MRSAPWESPIYQIEILTHSSMESNISHLIKYKNLNLAGNKIGVCGVREISKANWLTTIGIIYLC